MQQVRYEMTNSMHVHWLDYDMYNLLKIKCEVYLESEVANLVGIDFLNNNDDDGKNVYSASFL